MGDVMSLDQLDKVKADTQEILDKLSAMRATPVSELPGKYTVVNIGGKTETNFTNLVTVSGSGRLRCALLFPTYVDSSALVEMKITIDGVTFNFSGRTASFSNGARYDAGFVVASDILSGNDATSYYYYSIYGRSINIYENRSFPISNPQTEINSQNRGLVFSDTELRFENQLKIEGRMSSSGQYDAFILYSLDD